MKKKQQKESAETVVEEFFVAAAGALRVNRELPRLLEIATADGVERAVIRSPDTGGNDVPGHAATAENTPAQRCRIVGWYTHN